MRVVLLVLLATGCVDPADTGKHPVEDDSGTSPDTDTDTDTDTGVDGDGDGATGDDDCDDADPTVHVGATEICDGIDQDCDGTVDDGATDGTTWYADTDADGHGDEAATTTACDAPAGYVGSADDCDDGDATVYPGAPEDCDAAVDRNCDGSTGDTDLDGDGWAACLDCDDTNAAARPDGREVCDAADVDEDCDGVADDADTDTTGQAAWYRDFDGDGWAEGTEASVTQCDAPTGYTDAVGDCAIYDATISPDGAEVCDAADVDEDCDGLADDADASVDAATWSSFYADADADGFGAGAGITACDAPAGLVANAEDCDDADSDTNPDATEVCDAADTDEDCDGAADDATASGTTTWYADLDGDGYGDLATRYTGCEQPTGYVLDATDCDDAAVGVHPGATEICDAANADEDCDGSADDADASATGQSTWYGDADGDAYGETGTTASACDAPAGFVAASRDCDDTVSAINPGATEVCDALDTDEDCDGVADDASASGLNTWYADADGDAWGDATASTAACDQPSGYVRRDGDCDDAASGSNPGAAEVCDAANTDEDCDGLADDADTATGTSTWYADADADGYGDVGSTLARCDAPSGYVTDATDCDDVAATVNPGEVEVCDAANVDEDCDGVADDADTVATRPTWYADADGDGYGLSSRTTSACDAPAGYAASSGDCDDASSAVSPAASEVCDALDTDEDCDGVADDSDGSVTGTTTWYRDVDADGYGGATSSRARCDRPSGYAATNTDCNDASAAINPAASEVCDASDTDEDCDSLADDADSSATGQTTWHRDADSDGYGSITSTSSLCNQPSGYLTDGTDCNDASGSVHPGVTETCDGVDEDCDGSTDDDLTLYFTDYDGDGYGDVYEDGTCTPFSPSVTTGGDCDELDADVNPGAEETCNSIDDDCDDLVDDDDDSLAEPLWYDDVDEDGYGDETDPGFAACTQPDGLVDDETDCDDGDAEVSPVGDEVCNGIDDDCDDLVDDDDPDTVGDTVFYVDSDGDGYGSSSTELACEAHDDLVANDDDCDDTDASESPAATELYGDSVDDNCDGVTAPAQQACSSGAVRVCSSGCTYSTVTNALSSAASGSTICIDASSWSESVTYTGTNTYTIQGRGRAYTTLTGAWTINMNNGGRLTIEDVKFRSSHDVVVSDPTSGVTSYTTFRDCAIESTDPYGFAVDYDANSSGHVNLTIERCDISSPWMSVWIYASNSNADGDVTLRDNYIHGGDRGIRIGSFSTGADYTFLNNTVTGTDYAFYYQIRDHADNNVYLYNNILYGSAVGLYIGDAPSENGTVYLYDGHNLYWDNTDDFSGSGISADATDLIGSPSFESGYTPPRPSASSIALDAGYDTSTLGNTYDYWGLTHDSTPDIGCVDR